MSHPEPACSHPQRFHLFSPTQTIKSVASFASGRGGNMPMNSGVTPRGTDVPMASNDKVVIVDARWRVPP